MKKSTIVYFAFLFLVSAFMIYVAITFLFPMLSGKESLERDTLFQSVLSLFNGVYILLVLLWEFGKKTERKYLMKVSCYSKLFVGLLTLIAAVFILFFSTLKPFLNGEYAAIVILFLGGIAMFVLYFIELREIRKT